MVLVAALGAFACGGEKSGGGGEGEGMDGGVEAGTEGGASSSGDRVLQVEATTKSLKPVVEAYCKRAFRCCSEGELALQLGASIDDADACTEVLLSASFDYAQFRNRVPGLLALGYIGYGFDYGHVSIDEDAIDACAEQVEEDVCGKEAEEVCEPQAPPESSPCDAIFVGMRVEGDECGAGQSYECAEGLYCQNLGGDHSVCLPLHEEGDSCRFGGACAEGLVCDPQRSICTKGIERGDECEFVDPEEPRPGTEKRACAQGLACDVEKLVCEDARCHAGMYCQQGDACPEGLSCVAGQCGTLREDGRHCDDAEDCESGVCEYDDLEGEYVCGGGALPNGSPCFYDGQCASHLCDGETETCRAPIALGEDCGNYGTSGCAEGICEYDSDSGTQLCVDAGKDDADCTGDYQCATRQGFECILDKCRQTPVADGGVCTTRDQCESAQCVEGECVALGGEDDPCKLDQTLRCQEGYFCRPEDTEDGVCSELKSAGEPCDDDRECLSGGCNVSAGMKLCGYEYNALQCLE